jgi:hypothetical protein
MKKLLFLLALSVCAIPCFAQGYGGNITTGGANCTTATNCVSTSLPSTTATVSVTLSGTFSATVVYEKSGDNGVTWATVDTQSAVGVNSYSVSAMTNFRARASAFVSGNVGVFINASTAVTSSSSGGGSGSISTVIDTTASKYATPVGHTIPDATFTSGANTIDCTFSNDCNFASGTDNGSVCFGTNFTVDTSIVTPTAVVLPEGTLTVTDAQHATCSGGNSTATITHLGTFVWGKLGHTQLNSAWTDCLNANGCDFQLPGGLVLVEAPVGITQNTNATYIISQGYGRIHVRGWGASISMLVPTPNFSGAACVGGPSTDLNGCFFSIPSVNMSDFGIFGAGQGNLGAGFNGKAGVIVFGSPNGYNSYLNSLDLFSWGATTTGFEGIRVEGESDTTFHDVHNDGFGAVNCDINQSASNTTVLTTFEGSYCAVGNGPNLWIKNKGTFSSHGGVYGYTSGSGQSAVAVQDSAIANFSGDTMPYLVSTSGAPAELFCLGASICTLDGVYINNPTVGGFGIQDSTTGGVFAGKSQITGNAAAVITGGATSTFYSEGGNKYSSTTKMINLTTSGGKFAGNPTDTYLLGTVTDITPTCTITGAGSTATCAVFGTNESMVINVTSAGTGQTTTGTLTVTYSGSGFSPGLTAAGNIFCTPTLSNAGSAWAAGATIFTLSRTVATSSAYTWVNGATALIAANLYQFVLSCRAS